MQTLIQAIGRSEPLEDNLFNREWVSALSALGLFKSKPLAPKKLKDFRPPHVTLSLTSRCQLCCIYCHANGGEVIRDLNEDIIFSAINMVAQNALETGYKKFGICLQGEGEPTANWSSFKKTIITSEEVANKFGLEVEFALASNGIWSKHKREFIAKYFENIQISLDGLPEIQNQQRPQKNGSSSFSIVLDTLKFLDSKNVNCYIRSTVLPQGTMYMIPFIEMIARELKCKNIQFEPVYPFGRALNLAIRFEDFLGVFAAQFMKAAHRGMELGINIEYSGCRWQQYASNFCKSTGEEPNFFVSTDGNVSSCAQSIDPSSNKGRFTVYGHFDPNKKKLVFDETKLQRIRTFDVRKLNHCTECFLRWNCCGDCFAHSNILLNTEGEVIRSNQTPRCLTNREINLNELVDRARISEVTTKLNK